MMQDSRDAVSRRRRWPAPRRSRRDAAAEHGERLVRSVTGSGTTVLRRMNALGVKGGLAFSADRARGQGGSVRIPGHPGRLTYRNGVDPFVLEHVFVESEFAGCTEHLDP